MANRALIGESTCFLRNPYIWFSIDLLIISWTSREVSILVDGGTDPDNVRTFSPLSLKVCVANSSLPIFEIQSSQNFPMEQTLVPMMKRKITAYIFQIVNSEKFNNFDFEL